MAKFLRNATNCRQQREIWMKTRSLSKMRFVFLWGTAWGVSIVALQNSLRVLIDRKAIDWGILPISLVLASAVFWGWRYWIWNSNEKKFGPMLSDRPLR